MGTSETSPLANQRRHRARRRIALMLERRFERRRDPAAAEVAAATAHDFEGLAGHKHCLVVSFRRDGTPVPTPVWFGSDGERIFFRSRAGAAKVRRMQRKPDVRLAPCDDKGVPLGPAVEATVRRLAGDEKPLAEKRIAANQGLDRRIYMRFFSTPPDDEAYFEARAAGPR